MKKKKEEELRRRRGPYLLSVYYRSVWTTFLTCDIKCDKDNSESKAKKKK